MNNHDRYFNLIKDKLGEKIAKDVSHTLFPYEGGYPSEWVEKWIEYHMKNYGYNHDFNLEDIDYKNLPDELLKYLAKVRFFRKTDDSVIDYADTFVPEYHPDNNPQWFEFMIECLYEQYNSGDSAIALPVEIGDDAFVIVDPYDSTTYEL